jgi:hypothetical protein
LSFVLLVLGSSFPSITMRRAPLSSHSARFCASDNARVVRLFFGVTVGCTVSLVSLVCFVCSCGHLRLAVWFRSRKKHAQVFHVKETSSRRKNMMVSVLLCWCDKAFLFAQYRCGGPEPPVALCPFLSFTPDITKRLPLSGRRRPLMLAFHPQLAFHSNQPQ